MLRMNKMRFLSPDGEGSGGNTTETTTQTTQTTGDGAAAAQADFQTQLARHKGDALRYAEKLHERVYGLRQRAQEAEGKLPKEDQTIMPIADANALKAYREMGSAKEIQTEREELVRLRKSQMVNNAARVSGMNPKVLSTLLPGEAVLEVGEATDEDGQAKQAVYLVEEGKDKTLLDVYAAANWKDFLPALKAEEDPATGQPWIQQQGSTGGDAQNGMNKILAARLEKLNKVKDQKPRF